MLDRQPNNLSVYSDEEDEEDEEDGDDDDDDNYVDNIINNINDNDRDDDSNNYDCDINVGDNMSHQEGATTLTFRRSSSRGLGTEGGGNQLDEYRDTDIDMDDLFEGDEEEGMFEESDWVNVQGDELTGEALQFGYDKEFEAAAALMGVDAAAPRDLSMFAVGQELEAEWRSDAEDHNQRLGRVAGGGADDALDIRRLVDLFLQRTGAVQ